MGLSFYFHIGGIEMINFFKSKKTPVWAKITVIALATVLLLMVALTIYTYGRSTIFSGISAGGVELGGMTEEEARAALDKAYGEKYGSAELPVRIDDAYSGVITAEQVGITFSSLDTAKEAYSIGRDGGYFSDIFTVLGTVFSDSEVEISVNFDEEKLDALVNDLSEKYKVEPKDESYSVLEETLVVSVGLEGKAINTEDLKAQIKAHFENADFSEIVITREAVAPTTVYGIDKIYSEVHTVVSDAKIESVDGGSRIVPHVVGVDFDVDAAKKKYDANPGRKIEIPLTLTQPKVMTKHLETNLFKYKLVEVETHFSPKKVERTANVRLAAQLVNGTILNPGEEFSYNKVVGPRTTARGFKAAAIFAQGEVVDGIGGGICQVSSTIYMAALQANMKITERKNHSFYVDYTPKGEDATVVYGSIDFKFVNTHKYPVKIVATSKNNYIRIAFMGTEPDEVRKVKLTKKTHSTTPFTTREKLTEELPAGERKVEQKGQPGLSMTVYRNVYDKNGKLVESYVENTSKYKPMTEIVLVGAGTATSAAAPETAPAPETTPAPEAAPEATPAPETAPEEAPAPETAPEVAPEPETPSETPSETPAAGENSEIENNA